MIKVRYQVVLCEAAQWTPSSRSVYVGKTRWPPQRKGDENHLLTHKHHGCDSWHNSNRINKSFVSLSLITVMVRLDAVGIIGYRYYRLNKTMKHGEREWKQLQVGVHFAPTWTHRKNTSDLGRWDDPRSTWMQHKVPWWSSLLTLTWKSIQRYQILPLPRMKKNKNTTTFSKLQSLISLKIIHIWKPLHTQLLNTKKERNKITLMSQMTRKHSKQPNNESSLRRVEDRSRRQDTEYYSAVRY